MKYILALITALAFIGSAQAQEADKLVPGKLPSPSELGKSIAKDAKAAASATKDNAKAVAATATQKPADNAMAKPAAADAPKAAAPAAKKAMKKGKKKARKAAK